MSTVLQAPFWEQLTLQEMSPEQWESLCDGCAKCCMIKLEDEDTGEVHHTAMVCDLLDLEACRCTSYAKRHALVPDCVNFDASGAANFSWLPRTCAYRLLARGERLPEWHPLISGSAESVHAAGMSVRGRVIHEGEVHPEDMESMVVRWVDI